MCANVRRGCPMWRTSECWCACGGRQGSCLLCTGPFHVQRTRTGGARRMRVKKWQHRHRMDTMDHAHKAREGTTSLHVRRCKTCDARAHMLLKRM
eukprot:79092-Prorocentrum_minimum.AAC.3